MSPVPKWFSCCVEATSGIWKRLGEWLWNKCQKWSGTRIWPFHGCLSPCTTSGPSPVSNLSEPRPQHLQNGHHLRLLHNTAPKVTPAPAANFVHWSYHGYNLRVYLYCNVLLASEFSPDWGNMFGQKNSDWLHLWSNLKMFPPII